MNILLDEYKAALQANPEKAEAIIRRAIEDRYISFNDLRELEAVAAEQGAKP